MAKITLKGIVKRITPVETVGNNNTRKQSVILQVPERTNEFNEVVGKEEQWCLDLFNSKIDNLKLDGSWHEKKVSCVAYVSSSKIEKEGKILYIINSNLGSIEQYEPTQTQPAQRAQPSNNW